MEEQRKIILILPNFGEKNDFVLIFSIFFIKETIINNLNNFYVKHFLI